MSLDLLNPLREQRGVTLILIALLILVFIGVAALAIDIGHLFVVRNELQNAADAGCLAGARFLYSYSGDGLAVDENANQIAYQAAVANKSERNPVEVHWGSGDNEGDIERGHWCFATRTFTPNESTQPVDLWDVSAETLDSNLDFINAIRVKTRRQDTPAASFFARVFGYENFSLSTEAIAYIGFAGTLGPGEASQPIAICKEALLVDDKYTCVIGRRVSLVWESEREIGGWTDFSQDDPCTTGTNTSTVTSLVCNGGNPNPVIVRQLITTNPDDISSAFTGLRQCWETTTGRTQAWTLTLPVVSCPSYEMDQCQNMVGAVTIHVVWISGEDDDPSDSDVPRTMENPNTGTTWDESYNPNRVERWDSFVTYFNLQRLDGSPVAYRRNSIYFLPDCNSDQPKGRTGGENFGVLAKIPVLAK
jgi:hypothetical protein